MTIRDLLLARAEQDTPALLTRQRTWTWREFVSDAQDRAASLAGLLDRDRPPHVGLLMENTPEMLLGLAAAGLGGHVAVGVNNTRRGDALIADLRRADVQLLLTDPSQSHLLDGLDLGMPVIDTSRPGWLGNSGARPDPVLTDASLFMLIFTSGTSGRPKAVRITHEKVTYPGQYLAERLGLTASDVHYIAMPLFHSNAVMACWGPALTTGAPVALRERFSASEFIPDVRHFGATYASYVGKALTYVLDTPERGDDTDNPLRILFGNEAGDRDTRAFAERFACQVLDGFGSTENAVIVSRVPGTPPGSLGQSPEDVAILDEAGKECPPAQFDQHGRVTNLEECVGELVNTSGSGQFAGYYNDYEATAARMRGGMYWSGDLAYRDTDGWVYFAGRTSDWLRVDGENIACAPVEEILLRDPAIDQAAVYAVPDERSGDQVAAAIVLRSPLGPEDFERFLNDQPDLSPKARPRYVTLVDELPRTATNKVLKRELAAAGASAATWIREERGTRYS